MNIVVTGAAGAVGTYVVQILASRGHKVTAIDLPERKIVEHPNVKRMYMDLTNKTVEDFKPIVRSMDGVIHTAAIVDIGKTREEMWPLNVVTTRRLATAASEEMFCKFVHISSGSIYSPSKSPITESHSLDDSSAYETSKIHSEAAIHVVGENAADDFSWTILRPALIYGPRARFLGATLAALPSIAKTLGVRTLVGFRGGPTTNWVHAEDVARAAVHVMEYQDETTNRTFNIADDVPTPFGDTLSDYLEASGQRLLYRVPLPGMSSIRLAKGLIDRDTTFDSINKVLKFGWDLTRRYHRVQDQLSVKLDREASPYIFHNTIFDNSALKQTRFELKWPDHKNAIPYVLAWYQKNHWIP